MSKQKHIVVLPGIQWQIKLVQKLRSLGYRVTVINPATDSPAFPYADGHIVSDIFATDRYLPLLDKQHVDAVMSDECDIATELVATLADHFKVPSQTVPMAQLYTNKVKMREFLQTHHLPCPAFRICYSLEEALAFYRSLKKQMIIKPIDSNSSHGVFTIDSEDDLQKHFDESIHFSRTDKAVICEQYITGTEFTIDGIKTEYGHCCLAISEKKHYAHNDNIANELFFSYSNPQYDYNRLRAINDQYVNLSGLPFGLTHAEYKYENGEFYLIEIGARGGGNLISAEIVPRVSGYDNYDALIKKALGEPVTDIPTVKSEFKNRCAVLKFFDTPGEGGLVRAIEGIDFLDNDKHIITYHLKFKVGDYIEKAACDTARVGYYIAYAESREELIQLMNQIDKSFKIIY